MPMRKKILSTGPSHIFHDVGPTLLPEFPSSPEDLGAYLLAINPVVEVGRVTKSTSDEAKMNKLRLVIAFLNLYRLVEIFSIGAMRPVLQGLAGSGQVGQKLLHIIEFCAVAKDRCAADRRHRGRV